MSNGKRCVPGCDCKKHQKGSHSAETRQKLSEAARRRWQAQEYRANQQKAWTEERRKKVSEWSNKKCPAGCECKKHEKRVRSPESRQKMSESQKSYAAANPMSPERRANMSRIMKEKWRDEDFRDAQAERWKHPEAHDARSALMVERWQDPDYRQQHSDRRKGVRMKDGSAADGYVVWKGGYIMLTGQQGHPLANHHGAVFEHRKVLYDDVGEGPHPCHWHAMSGCGHIELEWRDIHVDHLDDDPTNNDLDNLVVSCSGCNWGRSRTAWYRGAM